MTDRTNDPCILSAAEVLPNRLKAALDRLSFEEKRMLSELRLREGRAFSALIGGEEQKLGIDAYKPLVISRDDIMAVLERATQSSMHSFENSIKNGFVTVSGGHRIGICGTAVLKDGAASGFRDISSLSMRVARQVIGAADGFLNETIPGEAPPSTLIVSPPGVGKTTFLRDLIRRLAQQYRIGVADERSELAGIVRGRRSFDLGEKSDVIDGCPKAAAVMLFLRAMNPEIIAVDEITAKEDSDALLGAFHCGVSLFATAHAENMHDLEKRMIYRRLILANVFSHIVFLKNQNGERSFELVRIGDERERPKQKAAAVLRRRNK